MYHDDDNDLSITSNIFAKFGPSNKSLSRNCHRMSFKKKKKVKTSRIDFLMMRFDHGQFSENIEVNKT